MTAQANKRDITRPPVRQAAEGLAMLLVLLIIAWLAVARVFPTRVTPGSAPPEVFSGERAMAHLPVIAREPHPEGLPAQVRVRDYLVEQLSALGLEIDIQRSGTTENVVARLRGSDSTGAIVVLAHYDSVRAGRCWAASAPMP